MDMSYLRGVDRRDYLSLSLSVVVSLSLWFCRSIFTISWC